MPSATALRIASLESSRSASGLFKIVSCSLSLSSPLPRRTSQSSPEGALAPWILGPASGVASVAADGVAPPRLGRLNAHGVPVTLLLVQGAAGTVFTLLFLLVPSVSTSYWMLSAVTAQIVIVAQPFNLTAGRSFGLTANILDAHGTLQTAYSGLMTVAGLYEGEIQGVTTVKVIYGVIGIAVVMKLFGDFNNQNRSCFKLG